MSEALGSEFTAVIPPKHSWLLTSHSDPDFVEQRRAKLESYLNDICSIEKARTNQAFVDFLRGKTAQIALSKAKARTTDSASTLSWAWSFVSGNEEEEPKGKKATATRLLSSVLIKVVFSRLHVSVALFKKKKLCLDPF